MTIAKYQTELADTIFADDYAPALTFISEEHRMIHDGDMFNISGVATAVANGSSIDLLFVCGAGTILHLTNVEYTLDDGPADIFFYEATTYSAAGTVVNIKNHNRLSSNTPGTVVTHTPTVTGVGTLLHQRYIPDPGGSPGLSEGSIVGGGDREWVIGNGDNYLWRLTNNSGGAIDIGYHLNGYEIGSTP